MLEDLWKRGDRTAYARRNDQLSANRKREKTTVEAELRSKRHKEKRLRGSMDVPQQVVESGGGFQRNLDPLWKAP